MGNPAGLLSIDTPIFNGGALNPGDPILAADYRPKFTRSSIRVTAAFDALTKLQVVEKQGVTTTVTDLKNGDTCPANSKQTFVFGVTSDSLYNFTVSAGCSPVQFQAEEVTGGIA